MDSHRRNLQGLRWRRKEGRKEGRKKANKDRPDPHLSCSRELYKAARADCVCFAVAPAAISRISSSNSVTHCVGGTVLKNGTEVLKDKLNQQFLINCDGSRSFYRRSFQKGPGSGSKFGSTNVVVQSSHPKLSVTVGSFQPGSEQWI